MVSNRPRNRHLRDQVRQHPYFEKEWPTFDMIRSALKMKLPDRLTREEVFRILGRVKIKRHRVCHATIYSPGLGL